MGIAAVPYGDLNSAKKFKKYMAKPWIARVSYEEEYNDYTWDAGEFDLLFSSDDMGMYLDEVAAKKKKDFDIRKYVKEILKPMVEWESYQLELRRDLKCLNLVRESLGLKVLPKDRKFNQAQKTYSYLRKLFVENRCEIAGESLDIIKKATLYSLSGTSVPRKYIGKSFNHAEFRFSKAKDPLKLLKGLKFITDKDYDSKYKRLKIFFKDAKASELKGDFAEVKTPLKTEARLRLQEGKSDKYWIAKVVKNELRVKFGRMGTNGRESIKEFATRKDALAELLKKVQEKKKKGYNDLT